MPSASGVSCNLRLNKVLWKSIGCDRQLNALHVRARAHAAQEALGRYARVIRAPRIQHEEATTCSAQCNPGENKRHLVWFAKKTA